VTRCLWFFYAFPHPFGFLPFRLFFYYFSLFFVLFVSSLFFLFFSLFSFFFFVFSVHLFFVVLVFFSSLGSISPFSYVLLMTLRVDCFPAKPVFLILVWRRCPFYLVLGLCVSWRVPPPRGVAPGGGGLRFWVGVRLFLQQAHQFCTIPYYFGGG